MTAVSTPLPVAAPAALNAAAGPAGNNGNADHNALPADFASMLKALSQAAGGSVPELAAQSAPDPRLAAVLNELQAAFGEPGEADDTGAETPLDIASILGQINAQAAIPALSPTTAADAAALEVGKDAAGPAGKGQEISSALLPAKAADDPAGTLKKDLAETKAEFSLAERPAVDHAALRAGEVGSARGAHAERAKLEVATPVHSPTWSAEVGQRVVWMARNNVQEAQLSVNPPNLGPIEITLSLKDDAATARFFSPHAEVREILEQALPRLREMLAGAGVQLGQSDVGAQSQQAFQQFSGRHNGTGNGQPSFSEEHPSLHGLNAVKQTAAVRTLNGNGLVDTFV